MRFYLSYLLWRKEAISVGSQLIYRLLFCERSARKPLIEEVRQRFDPRLGTRKR